MADPESRPIMSQSDKDRRQNESSGGGSVNTTEPQPYDIETGHAGTLSETHAATGGDDDPIHSRSHPPIDRSKSSLMYDGPLYAGPHTDSLRKGFLRKVYGLLSTQLLVTVLVSCICMYSESVRHGVIANGTALIWTSFAFVIVFLIGLFCYKSKYPANMYLLGGFTLAMSVQIGVVCAVYQEIGAGDSILMAFVLTLAIFVGLTIFTLQSRIDFSWMGAGLGVCLWVLIIWGFINLIFGYRDSFLYSLFGAIVFSLFIIFDTYMISKKYGYDDYVIASIELYLDVINLFLYLLQLISRNRD